MKLSNLSTLVFTSCAVALPSNPSWSDWRPWANADAAPSRPQGAPNSISPTSWKIPQSPSSTSTTEHGVLWINHEAYSDQQQFIKELDQELDELEDLFATALPGLALDFTTIIEDIKTSLESMTTSGGVDLGFSITESELSSLTESCEDDEDECLVNEYEIYDDDDDEDEADDSSRSNRLDRRQGSRQAVGLGSGVVIDINRFCRQVNGLSEAEAFGFGFATLGLGAIMTLAWC